MSSKRTLFFATLKDIEPILHDFESKFSVQYFELDMLDSTDDIAQFSSVFDIPQLGYSKTGNWNKDQMLLIINANGFLKIKRIPQRKGGIKYTFDEIINPQSIHLRLGGTWDKKVLVAGLLEINDDNDFSIQSYKYLSSKIKKQFKKINDFYVGIDAEEKLQAGWRLVTSAGLGKEFDLQYE